MKHLPTLLIICALGFFAWKKFLSSPPEKKLSKHSSYLSCQGNTFDHKVKYPGEIVLVKRALPQDEKEREQFFYNAINYQSLYTFTNIPQIFRGGPVKNISLGQNPKVKILNVEDALYPREVIIPGELSTVGFGKLDEEYLKKIISYRHIEKDEPAVKVSYEFETDIVGCLNQHDSTPVQDMKFRYPPDPYLAYFTVPMVQQRPVSHPNFPVTARVNPCVNQDVVSASGIPPFTYWYSWLPDAKGHDAEKVPFDCTLFYEEGKSIHTARMTFEENLPKNETPINFAKFEDLNRPIRISFFMSANDDYSMPPISPDIRPLIERYLGDISSDEARKILPLNTAEKDKYDKNISKLLIFLWSLTQHVEIKNAAIDVSEFGLKILLQSKFKLSKKDLELKVVFSPNGIQQGKTLFADNFSQDILRSDVVVYDGHSGLGSTFILPLELARSAQTQNSNPDLKYQILALYSCNSSFYFRPEFFPTPGGPDFQRTMIRTGGAYLDVAASGSTGLFASIDTYLYNESYLPFGEWARSFGSDNFYVLSN